MGYNDRVRPNYRFIDRSSRACYNLTSQNAISFCVNCKMEWHTNLSCAEFRKTKAYTKSGTAVLDAPARELGPKKCRKCLCTVERAKGCNL
ncbi:hypothetical protein YC2023_103792 [Brassica napus]